MKEQKITIPDGFKLEKVSETEYKIIPDKNPLPKTWEEFCETNPKKPREFFISSNSYVFPVNNIDNPHRSSDFDKNLLAKEEQAEAILALCQLIQLRDCYNDGWKPSSERCYLDCVYLGRRNWVQGKLDSTELFVFRNQSLAKDFLNNFKDLLDKLKPLYQ